MRPVEIRRVSDPCFLSRADETTGEVDRVALVRDALDRAQKKGFRLLYAPAESKSGTIRRTVR